MLVPLCVLAGVGALILHAVGHTCNESLIHGPVAIKEYLHLMSSEVKTHFCRSPMRNCGLKVLMVMVVQCVESASVLCM